MTILEQMKLFSDRYGKSISVNQITWRYYRLGAGAPILWLTGGLRRAALGFAFLERLATRHLVIAPDYPPVQTVDEFLTAFDTILHTEGIQTCTLAGQSYGGFLAQAYLAHRPGMQRFNNDPGRSVSKALLPGEFLHSLPPGTAPPQIDCQNTRGSGNEGAVDRQGMNILHEDAGLGGDARKSGGSAEGEAGTGQPCQLCLLF